MSATPSPINHPGPVCAYCHAAKAPSVQLDKEGAPDILTMCLPCLRSATLMKAALSEQRGVQLLRQNAEERGLAMWRSSHVVYLLPAVMSQAASRRPVMAHP
ncbi:MAG: hypothetical protein V4510_02535 [bacterium]